MRVGFVTPRYGPEVIGGAEAAARALAEHLVSVVGWQAEVFTSCALDHLSWGNEIEPGLSELNGVRVHRFSSVAQRGRDFYDLDGKLRRAPRRTTMTQAERWVELNGPVVPQLIEAVAASNVDVFAFYPYLYYPTVRAIGKVTKPAVLHPAAHDEPALYFPVYGPTFSSADGLCYHTASERALVQGLYQVAERPQIVLGLGVGEDAGTGRPGGEVLGIGDRPYVVSVGRVDEHKGSMMLASFFRTFKELHPSPLALALVGPVAARIPPHPDVLLTGPVSEADKWDIVRDASVSISPSALESFSLVLMEAWSQSVPALVNRMCPPTREHCVRSGGGLWFGSYREFDAALARLLRDPALRHLLGSRGRAYVDRYYRWPDVITRYAHFVEEVAARGRRPTSLRSAALMSR